MPIVKRHGSGAQVALSFKDHLGSIADPLALHPWIMGGCFDLSHNPMVDIYRNSNIVNKTVLTIGDGLFGNKVDNLSKPSRWSSCGNQAPNSLLSSIDPVAIDCVMSDLLHAEVPFSDGANRMLNSVLIYANSVGLGTFERGDLWGSGYSQIDYLKVEV